jgi:hypothetical protein
MHIIATYDNILTISKQQSQVQLLPKTQSAPQDFSRRHGVVAPGVCATLPQYNS